jgi:hypothetical protein
MIKRFLPLTITLSLFFVTPSIGQIRGDDLKRNSVVYNEWGVTAGLNMQQLVAYPFARDYGIGGVAGVYYKKTKKSFGLQAAVTASTASYTTDAAITDPTAKVDVIYVNVPLIAEVKSSKRIALQAGLTYQYLLSISADDAGKKLFDEQKLFKQSNVFILMGVEYAISKKLGLGVRYGIGMANLNNEQFKTYTDTWMATNGQVTLKYMVKKLHPKKH